MAASAVAAGGEAPQQRVVAGLDGGERGGGDGEVGCFGADTGASVRRPDFLRGEGGALGRVKRQLAEAPPGSGLGFRRWRGREKR
jgi:hypothetical protein